MNFLLLNLFSQHCKLKCENCFQQRIGKKKICKQTTGGRLLTKWMHTKVSSFSPAVLYLPFSCTEAKGTWSIGGTRCCAALILSVTVHPGWTKTVLRRQAWSRELHRILLQAGLCLCQVLPSYTQQTLCSVSPHSHLWPVCTPLPLCLFFSPFLLFRAG